MRRPSGDQDGEVASMSHAPRRFAAPPPLGIVHSAPWIASTSLLPSGDAATVMLVPSVRLTETLRVLPSSRLRVGSRWRSRSSSSSSRSWAYAVRLSTASTAAATSDLRFMVLPSIIVIVVVIVVMPAVPALLARHAALEVRSVVRAARAGEHGDSRIDAERTRAVDHAAGQVRGNDAIGGLALLDPLLERGEHVEGVRPGAARAVLHAGNHEQAEEVVDALACVLPVVAAVTHEMRDFLEVVDRVERRDVRIAPAVIDDELGAAALE